MEVMITLNLLQSLSKKSKHKSLCSLQICDDELYVADTKWSNMGLVHFDQNGDTVFIRAPRKAALEITKMSDEKVLKEYCKSLHYAEMAEIIKDVIPRIVRFQSIMQVVFGNNVTFLHY